MNSKGRQPCLLEAEGTPVSCMRSICIFSSAAGFVENRVLKPPTLLQSRAAVAAATAAAKSLQSCPTLCDPIDGSPPGSPVPGILQARTLEWVAIAFFNA